MKKLKKVLLIHWFYYDKLLLDFEDVNYLTGKNASGKSTFIDALMIVLLGEVSSRNFNKAANESSQRSLQVYLRANKFPHNPNSRKGKAFNTYIACEFFDDITAQSFTLGIVFECYADGDERYNFFTFDGPIPGNCFITGQKPMDISELRNYLRTEYKTRQEMYDSNKKYRAAIKAKWNVHVDQIFSLLKKGVFFKPIDNIQQFITENVCDLPDKPDIVAMQQNIQDYKYQEQLAKKHTQRQERLQIISELYYSSERALDTKIAHEYLKARAEKEIQDGLVEQYENELQNYTEKLAAISYNYDESIKRIEDLGNQRDQLLTEKLGSDIYKEQARLEQLKAELETEQQRLEDEMKKAANNIRVEAFRWGSYCAKLLEATWPDQVEYEDLQSVADDLKRALSAIEQFTMYEFGATGMAVFTGLQHTMRAFTALLRENYYKLNECCLEKRQALDEAVIIMKKLEQGIKDYDPKLLELKERIELYLANQAGDNVKVEILADLLEINDPEWQRAIEGYLHNQKFHLLVAPQHYDAALRVYDEIKHVLYGFGLVDIGKLRQKKQLHVQPGSLAAKISTDNDLARDYIAYLLGRVICCPRREELRQHVTAITAEGMLYQSFVSRALSPKLMDNCYIGQFALMRRRALLAEKIKSWQAEYTQLNSLHALLAEQQGKDLLFSDHFMQETLGVMPQKNQRRQEIIRENQAILNRLDQLDLDWISRLEKKISLVEQQIKETESSKDECARAEGECRTRIERLEQELLPHHRQEREIKETVLSMGFSEQYAAEVGDARYLEELKRLKSPGRVLKNFGDSLEQSAKAYDRSRDALVNARREYVNSFPPCSYQPDALHNEEFAAELKLLQEVMLPQYQEKIRKARESALEQFQNDFLAKIKTNIDSVKQQVKDLNKALKKTWFGADQYQFIVECNPDYADYYNMIMDPNLMEDNEGLFTLAFQDKYGHLIESLFTQIVASDDKLLNARQQSELQENIERYTDYRTYLHFDLETTDQNDNVEFLSKTLKTDSGGEMQTPFYIAMLASFAQVYRVHDTGNFGNTLRLIVFDEAFNKMDSERIVQCVRQFRRLNLQAIFCTPPDKLPDIMPEADRTLLALKEGYTMQILPWSKSNEAKVNE